MKKALTILFTLITLISYTQEFKTTIWIEDTNGRIDSVTIGYDPLASESINVNFGASDITNQPWTAFEIRASQIDVTEIINGEDVTNPRPINELSRYQTKTEIIPKNCLSIKEVTNQAGYIPFIALFIATDAFPITIRWKQVEFENDCLSKSIVSDWPITTWWDIPCCPNLEIGQTLFAKKNQIVINKHIGMKIVNENADTLIMLNIALLDGLGTNTSEIKDDSDITIFPNPSNGIFCLPNGAEIVKISDNMGRLIAYHMEGGELSIDEEGLFYVQMNIGGNVITKRLLNYSR
jgi:hypothetical protein